MLKYCFRTLDTSEKNKPTLDSDASDASGNITGSREQVSSASE